MRRSVLLVLGLLVVFAAADQKFFWNWFRRPTPPPPAQAPPEPQVWVHYVSQYKNKDPNVDHRYRSSIRATEEKHRQQYEQEVARRVHGEALKQSVIERQISKAQSETRRLQLKKRQIHHRIRALQRNSEVAISRRKLRVLRGRYDRASRALRRNLVREEQLDHKYRDQRKIVARMERMEQQRRQREAEAFHARMQRELDDDKRRMEEEKAEADRLREQQRKQAAEEAEHKEKMLQAERAAEQRRQKDFESMRQSEREKEISRQQKVAADTKAAESEVESQVRSEKAAAEAEDRSEQEQVTSMLDAVDEYERNQATKALEEKEREEVDRAAESTQDDARRAREQIHQTMANTLASAAR